MLRSPYMPDKAVRLMRSVLSFSTSNFASSGVGSRGTCDEDQSDFA